MWRPAFALFALLLPALADGQVAIFADGPEGLLIGPELDEPGQDAGPEVRVEVARPIARDAGELRFRVCCAKP